MRFSAASHEGLVAESTAIVNAAGEILARLPPPRAKDAASSLSFNVAPLPGAPAGFQAIHLGLPDIEVNGLVPSASYQKQPPSVGTIGHGSGTGRGRSPLRQEKRLDGECRPASESADCEH